jgi:hypothetical protein
LCGKGEDENEQAAQPFESSVFDHSLCVTNASAQGQSHTLSPNSPIEREHAGHFAFVTHREEFLAALVKYVRPWQ